MANEVTIHVKAEGRGVDRDMDVIGKKVETSAKRSFLKNGGHAGAAFMAGFIKTITLGQVGSGFAMAATKMAPQMAHLGGALGVALAGALAVKLASSLSALLPLALGGGILAGPIIYLISKQVKGLEALKKNKQEIASLDDRLLAKDKQINAIADRVLHSKGKTKEAALKQLEAEKQNRREMEKEWATLKKQQTMLEQMTAPLQTLKKNAKDFMETVSKPVALPFVNSIYAIADRLPELGTKIAKAIKPLARELEPFIQYLLDGITNFGKEIGKKMPEITRGFRQWGKELPGIGKALGKMLAAWVEDGPAVEKGVRNLAGSMKDLAHAVGAVGRGFRSFNKLNNSFKEVMEKQREMILEWRIAMLKALITVADAWGLISPAGRKAAASLRKSLASANQDLDKSRKKLSDFANTKAKAKVEANISDLEAKIRTAKKRLRETHNQKTRSKIEADIRQLQARVAAAKAALRGVKNRQVIISAIISKGFDHAVARARQIAGRGIPARASGGITSAATGGERGNQVLVGEQGPEIVDLPMGSHVNSNADSRRIAGEGGGSGGGVHFHFHGPVYGDHNALKRALVNMKRAGDLDLVLR